MTSKFRSFFRFIFLASHKRSFGDISTGTNEKHAVRTDALRNTQFKLTRWETRSYCAFQMLTTCFSARQFELLVSQRVSLNCVFLIRTHRISISPDWNSQFQYFILINIRSSSRRTVYRLSACRKVYLGHAQLRFAWDVAWDGPKKSLVGWGRTQALTNFATRPIG